MRTRGERVAISCFFCENLLSDYIENLLPLERKKEIEEHLKTCETCNNLCSLLLKELATLGALPKQSISKELSLEIADIIDSKSSAFSKRKITTLAISATIMLLIFFSIVALYPASFPLFFNFLTQNQKETFVRYYPLLNGANLVIEEQAHWLNNTELTKTFLDQEEISTSEFEKLIKPEGQDLVK